VRSYFLGFDRRRTRPLLREAHTLEHVVCRHDLEAAVLELRLVAEHDPRYNRPAGGWRRYRYVEVPRLAVVRTPKGGRQCVGPFPSTGDARRAAADPRALERTATRQRRVEALVRAGRLEVAFDGGGAIVDHGRLAAVWEGAAPPPSPPPPCRPVAEGPTLPVPLDVVDEVRCVARWLEAGLRSRRLRLVSSEHGWAEPLATVA
jgi:hypothetical protein